MRQEIQAICEVLKQKFTNLTVSETVDLAFKIYEALEKVRKQ